MFSLLSVDLCNGFHITHVITSLRALATWKGRIVWTEKALSSFYAIGTVIFDSSIQALPNLDNKFYLYTEASKQVWSPGGIKAEELCR